MKSTNILTAFQDWEILGRSKMQKNRQEHWKGEQVLQLDEWSIHLGKKDMAGNPVTHLLFPAWVSPSISGIISNRGNQPLRSSFFSWRKGRWSQGRCQRVYGSRYRGIMILYWSIMIYSGVATNLFGTCCYYTICTTRVATFLSLSTSVSWSLLSLCLITTWQTL